MLPTRFAERRAALDEPAKILQSTPMGDALEAERYDRDSVNAAIDDLRRRMTAANDLAVTDLPEVELKKKIAALRAEPLPEIQKIRFERESGRGEWRESA
jgi:hypothetical protein